MFTEYCRPSLTKSVLSLSTVLLLTGFVYAQEPADKVVAEIDGVAITERELSLAEVDMLQQFADTPADKRRAAILNALVDIKLLAKAAEDAGQADDPGFKARMAFNRSRILHNDYFQEKALKVITDEELQTRYNKEIEGFPSSKEIRARHILVEAEETAKEIISELEGGASFEELAKTKSTGPSGPSGGDLGYFGKGQMVPEFEKAAFELGNGKFTTVPVKTQFGWHVIFKEDERDAQPPAFDDVKEQIRRLVAQEKYFNLIQDARAKYKPEILDEDLKAKIDTLK